MISKLFIVFILAAVADWLTLKFVLKGSDGSGFVPIDHEGWGADNIAQAAVVALTVTFGMGILGRMLGRKKAA